MWSYPQMCSLRWPELFLLLFQSSNLLAHVGGASWPLSFPQPEMRTAGFLSGETQPFLNSSQPELHVRAALVMFPPVHHQNRPNKKPRFSLFPCGFTSPVHLTLSCHPLFLSGPVSDLETGGSSTSLKGRAGHPEGSLCQCLEMWSWQGLLLHSFPLQGVGIACSVPASSAPRLSFPGAGLGCLSSFPQSLWCS